MSEMALDGDLALESVPRVVARLGGVWVVLLKTLDQAAQFLARLAVARAIGPADFGALGVTLLVMTIFESLTESGIRAALIQRRDISVDHIDSAWTYGLLRGIAGTAVLVALAGPIGRFFGSPESVDLIRWFAVIALLRAAASPAITMLERRLAFRFVATLSMVRSVITLVVTVVAVQVEPSPFALVIGFLAGELVACAGSFLAGGRIPRPRIVRSALGQLLRYGRWIAGSTVALLLLLNLDDVVVGRVGGPRDLALYQLAFMIGSLPTAQVSMVLNRVTFVSFSRLRAEPARLARAFLRVYGLTAALVAPMALLLAVLAEDGLVLLAGPQWADAAGALSLLAIAGALRALGAVSTPLLRAVDRTKLLAVGHWAMVIGLAVVIVPLTRAWGPTGAALAVVGVNAGLHWFRYGALARSIGKRAPDVLSRLLVPLVGCLVMLAVLAALRQVWDLAPAESAACAVRLGVQVLVGTAAYTLVVLVLDRRRGGELVDTARTYVGHLRKEPA